MFTKEPKFRAVYAHINFWLPTCKAVLMHIAKVHGEPQDFAHEISWATSSISTTLLKPLGIVDLTSL